MAKFYFDVWEKGEVLRDDVGTELPDINEVEREASETALQIARDRLSADKTGTIAVEAKTARGKKIFKATVNLETSREQGEQDS